MAVAQIKMDDKKSGEKEITAYLECSWKTAKKRMKAIKDKNICYKTTSGKWVLIASAYERKYGSPRIIPA